MGVGIGWVVGDATELGKNRGLISAVDGALLPERVAATWKVANEGFQEAPALRCVTGAAGEAFMAARAAQVAAGAATAATYEWSASVAKPRNSRHPNICD